MACSFATFCSFSCCVSLRWQAARPPRRPPPTLHGLSYVAPLYLRLRAIRKRLVVGSVFAVAHEVGSVRWLWLLRLDIGDTAWLPGALRSEVGVERGGGSSNPYPSLYSLCCPCSWRIDARASAMPCARDCASIFERASSCHGPTYRIPRGCLPCISLGLPPPAPALPGFRRAPTRRPGGGAPLPPLPLEPPLPPPTPDRAPLLDRLDAGVEPRELMPSPAPPLLPLLPPPSPLPLPTSPCPQAW
jgi:hypothetical protein